VSGERGKHLSHSSKVKLGSKGGTTQSFGGPLAIFLIFHEFMSKGAPLFLGNGHLGLLA
jgi:hypothetical protein